MTNEEKLTVLYDKMCAEQDTYRDWLKGQSPEEILQHTFEYTTREDILAEMEIIDLTEAQTDALLSSPSPLADVYKKFSEIETDYMDVISSTIEDHADAIIQRQQEERCPVYRLPASYAVEHDELPQYQTSCHANIACKEAIETAIRNHYLDNHLDKSCAADVLRRFGIERVEYVLAATIQDMDWDGRISCDNKAWAKTVLVQENKDSWGQNRNLDFVISQAHPGLIDLFTTQVRKHEKAQVKDRPSVMEQLHKKIPAPPSTKKAQEQER